MPGASGPTEAQRVRLHWVIARLHEAVEQGDTAGILRLIEALIPGFKGAAQVEKTEPLEAALPAENDQA